MRGISDMRCHVPGSNDVPRYGDMFGREHLSRFPDLLWHRDLCRWSDLPGESNLARLSIVLRNHDMRAQSDL